MLFVADERALGTVENMATWRNFAALFFALTAAASHSWAQSQSVLTQPDVVVFWDAAKCVGGYHSDFYSAHCEPGFVAQPDAEL